MRFMSYHKNGQPGLAVETSDGWCGLSAADKNWPGDLDEIVRTGEFEAAFSALSAGIPVDPAAVTPALPFSRAAKILCVGLNYKDHADESSMELPSNPTVFVRFNDNLVAHNGALVAPKVSDNFDYEGEMVAVIGKRGRAISREDALDHVAGYTVFNDGSIRDFQLRVNQWTVGKNFDNTGSMGPHFVTADELPAGGKGLRLRTRLNGETVQDASTDDLVFSVADLIAELSVAMTLEPGDLIVTGTPSGVGAARDPKLWMKPGDIVEVEIEKIGLLKNAITAE